MEQTCTGQDWSPLGSRSRRRPAIRRGCDGVPERRRAMLSRVPRAVALAILLGALFLGALNAVAGTTGKLHGTVTSDKKEPLVGVNVRIEGLRLGVMTDEKGEFVLIGVPAGTYMVHANLLGYAGFTAGNVTITPDFTTELPIVLKTEAVQMEEVHVEAERPLLQKDATGSTRFISGQDIAKLPVRGYKDAAAQQAGVVNVITKEGGDRYGGSLEAVTDNFTGTGNELFRSRVYDYNIYDGAFGGPLLPGKDAGSFYLSGQRRWQRDRSPRINFDTPLPSNSLGGWTGQGKLSL